MTASQIKYVLAQKGYKENEWTDLKSFTCIMVDQDTRIYSDPKVRKFKFDGDFVNIVEGRTLRDGTFVTNGGSEYSKDSIGNISDSDINHRIDYDHVGGFIQTSKMIGGGILSYQA